MDYTGGGGGYDYGGVDGDIVSSTNLNNAVEADMAIGFSSDMFHNVTSTTTAPLVAFNDNVTEGMTSCGSHGPANYPADMLIITAVCAFIIAVLGSFGNLLTIIALPMSRKLRTTATAFVVNLAVVELLFCALILPMSGAQYWYLERNRVSLLNDNHCIFFTVTRYTLTQVELQTILAIALTRALAVAVPSMYTFLNKSSVIASYITFIWLYSFLLKLPTALGVLGSYGFNRCTMECDMVSGDPMSRFVMVIIEAVIPVLVIIVLYIFVFVMVKRSSNRVAKSMVCNNSTKAAPPSNSNASTSSGNTERKGSNSSFKSLKRMVSESSLRARLTHQSSTVSQRLGTNRRDMRVARTIFIIFVLVLLCSVPAAMVHMTDRNAEQPVKFLAIHILYWLQYCLNVVIYVFMNRQYRDAYVVCLARVFPQIQRHQGKKFFWERASISSKQPQNLPTSSKPRLDSADVVDSTASEPEAVPANHAPPIGVQGRLSTIPEANSSSVANDSVFSDPGKKEREAQQRKEMEENSHLEDEKCFETDEDDSEEELPEQERKALMEKQHWVTENGGSGGDLPKDESKV